MRHRKSLLAGSLATVLLASLSALTPAGANPSDTTSAVGNGGATSTIDVRTVTLITGDRVTVTGENAAVIRRGPGREGITYLMQRRDGDLHVIPSDALSLLRDGRLDRRLFNVSLLQDYGYHDGRPDLPLIVIDEGAPAALTASSGGAVQVVQDLPAVDGVAVQADKGDIDGFWALLTGGDVGAAATGSTTVWLDGLRQPQLDGSVPQVGAPAAWDVGLDGAGVTVAVLDTGIDATHLDLVDRIAGSENFTDGFEDNRDLVGHGTHVASIIAGSGAASESQYQGVAPGAKLLDGKVCAEFGCAESWILAGMQWAAEQGATVVNMSLGGPDRAGFDPLKQAVESLTEQYGVLFVISAGNDGADGSIGSPASADAALAVGAVDAADDLAWFSSRGPRVDGAVKPDLTAPGVSIVAANSVDGFLGEPGESYTALSGTSMSAPHVAGAAAILAQEHPDLPPKYLKATLMGAALPHPHLAPYSQGAGRLDIAGAIAQTVIADPPSVSFSRSQWPHDTAVDTQTVTYLNAGPAEVTLALEISATGPDGEPAPEGFFTLGDPTVTVPARGSAQVSIAADTSVGDLDGYFGGYLTATAADVTVVTAFAVEREEESYDLTLVHTDRDGQPTAGYSTSLIRFDDSQYIDVFGPDTVTVRLPAGEYTLISAIEDYDAEEFEVTLLAQPLLTLDRDRSVDVDARAGQPISVTVPDPQVSPASTLVMGEAGAAGFGVFALGFDGVYSGQIGPEQTVEGFVSSVSGTWAQHDPEYRFDRTPDTYGLAWFTLGQMVTGLTRDVQRRDLATVRVDYARHITDASVWEARYGTLPGVTDGAYAPAMAIEVPGTRTHHHNTDGGIRWGAMFMEEIESEEEFGFPILATVTQSEPIPYRPGRVYREAWNQGVFGPVLPETVSPGELPVAVRDGDQLQIAPRLYGDAAGRTMWTQEAGSVAVFRDGELVAKEPSLEMLVQVPAEAADYRVEVDATRDGGTFPLSTRTSVVWGFRSAHVEQPTALPVSVVRFAPRLDGYNAAPAGRPFLVPVEVTPLSGSVAGDVQHLTVEASFNDGNTWQEVRVPGGRFALVHHPAGDGFVSLRATAVDRDGNSVEQTIIRAYRITG